MALSLGGPLAKDNPATAPSPNLTGLPMIDKAIAMFTAQIQKQSILGTKQLKLQTKGLKMQRKQNAAELAAYQVQLAQSQVQPAPQVSSLSSPEVMQAQRQVAIDASNRTGFRKSILAGNTGGFSGSLAARTPILA